MKKVLLFLFIAFVLTSVSVAQTVAVNENFDYGTTASGDIVTTSNNAWTRHSGTQGPTYAYPGLTLTGYVGSGIGGAISFTAGGSGVNDGDVNKTFTPAFTTTSDVYIAFMLNVSEAKATADYFFHIGAATMGTNFRARVFCKSSTNGYVLGLSKSTEAAVYSTFEMGLNTTYLVVLKYALNTTGTNDDLLTLYVYSAFLPVTEPGTPATTIGPIGAGLAGDLTDVGTIAIRQGSNSPTAKIDGIRVSPTWGNGFVGVEKEANLIPNTYSLDQNYPNPFNPSTQISFSVPETGFYNLKVYDILGKEVATLVNEELSAGKYRVDFNASNLASGTYIYSLKGNNVNLSHKMLLVK